MKPWLRLVLALLLPGAIWGQVTPQTSAFPHAKHAKLFPLCSSCHSGIPTGDFARSFPAPALCANCHDGTTQPRVNWSAPRPRGAGLLVFSHPSHLAKAKDVTCATCHAVADTSQWMNVAHAVPERCFSCHTHQTSAHFAADNTCAKCHRPLVSATALSETQVAQLPKPSTHSASDFIETHGTLAHASETAGATCATCHARESCERCHVNAGNVPIIRALGNDARVARLERGKEAVYPTPADHRSPQFALLHGNAARTNTARCATCHARPSCETCHTGSLAQDVLRQLPDAKHATAPGVQLQRINPPSGSTASLLPVAVVRVASTQSTTIPLSDTTRHRVTVHPAGFAKTHGVMASSGELTCAGCHSQRFCSDCHAGEKTTRRYHAANFVATHAPQAYGRETDCATCHSTEAFCRSCHRQAGLAAKTNARSTVFHNAQPLWLLQHGRAARQDLNACTTCHQQTYCMQCHSDRGSRINPHGPGFDAAKMSSKNPELCLLCHFKNPLGG